MKKIKYAVVILLILVLIAALLFMRRLDKNSPLPDTAETDESSQDETDYMSERPELEYDGVTYYLRNGITSYLILGADQSDLALSNQELVEENYICKMADMLILVVVDQPNKCYTTLQLDRNTMTPVQILTPEGDYADVVEEQLCTAYYYGHDAESACENTRNVVSDLLCYTPIDHYLSLDMDSIGKVNNIAGGVTVTLEDDFSAEDPNMTKGRTLKLTDEQAEIFTVGRMEIGSGDNEGRLRRQRSYINGFIASLIERVKEDSSYINTAYDEMTDLMTTDTSGKDTGKIANVLLTYEDKGIVTIDGQTSLNDTFGDGVEHEEFTPDEDSLTQTVIDLFYTEDPSYTY